MDIEKSTEDTRIRKRIHFVADVSLNIDGDITYYTESRDVSMSGIFLLTDSPPTVGANGQIKITLEVGERKLFVHADCEVVRTVAESDEKDGNGAGIHFTSIDTESSINLFNIIKYQCGGNGF